MKLTSSAFEEGGSIPSKYTCDGDGINPPLAFHDVPAEAKSLVLIVTDPDVPKNLRADGLWVHWLVIDMPPSTKEIAEDTIPKATIGTGTQMQCFQGPCPPDREHRYFFKLYALDTTLGLPTTTTKPDLEKAMTGHALAEAQLMGRYERTS